MLEQKPSARAARLSGLPLAILVMVGILFVLFSGAFKPGHVLFSNDGPLGALMAECNRMPASLTGTWNDLNTLGTRGGGSPISVTYLLMYLAGPVLFSRIYQPFAILFMGLAAWVFFRSLKLSPVACLSGAIAASLNSGLFSAACWGVAAHNITIGFSMLAMAAMSEHALLRRLPLICLAGLCVGGTVVEGADIGALFSMFVALFVVYQSYASSGVVTGKGIATGVGRVAVVAVFAGIMAVQTVTALVEIQIKGVAGIGQDAQSKEQRWDWATQWSLPKSEALGFVVPGVFGYRMDTPDGGVYWGAVGRDPSWDRYFAGGKQGAPPQGILRFTGGGVYAGALVALVAVWAALQGLRRKDLVFSIETRRWIWFWTAVLLASLLLSFGRFAPFYQFLYALPYFSTIRNPAKFTHFVNLALVVLFAYGVNGLWRQYMNSEAAAARFNLKGWWAKAKGFDRRWVIGCGAALGAGLLGWLIFSSSRKEFIEHLQEVQFDASMAQSIASFSSRQLALGLLTMALAMALLLLTIAGAFSGAKWRWGALALGAFLVLDLARANLPWIIVWDYEQKYASNEILDRLREKPYERRVAIAPSWMAQFARSGSDPGLLDQIYRIEWAQHHFLYYNILSLDIVQMSRMPADLLAFETALGPRQAADLPRLVPRRWELTSTGYLLGMTDYLPFLNSQLDPGKSRFRIAERFSITAKPGIEQPRKLEELTAVRDTNGPYALFEFTGALPRVKLFASWLVKTNDQATLDAMTSVEFNPWESVIVPEAMPAPGGDTNTPPGTAEITSYHPKKIVIDAKAASNSVLLMTDRHDPNWKITVDGKPAPLIRANYLMRGVFLTPGQHKVEFSLEPSTRGLYISLVSWIAGALLAVVFLMRIGAKGRLVSTG